MWRKLLLYMLALVLAVGVFVSCGLFFAGQFSTTTEKYSNNLTFQNEFYTRQIEKYFDDLSMMGEMLAADSSAIIDAYLTENGIDFGNLDNSRAHTEGVQKALLPKLREELLKADASGAWRNRSFMPRMVLASSSVMALATTMGQACKAMP